MLSLSITNERRNFTIMSLAEERLANEPASLHFLFTGIFCWIQP
jgi:hypothetical protein